MKTLWKVTYYYSHEVPEEDGLRMVFLNANSEEEAKEACRKMFGENIIVRNAYIYV